MPETPPKSKKSSGAVGANIGNAVFHSAPADKEVTNPRVVLNVEPKFYNENLTAINTFVDSTDFESSATSDVAKEFDFNKGFKGSEPIILLSSEFSSFLLNSSSSIKVLPFDTINTM